jgi:hypothetical protein
MDLQDPAEAEGDAPAPQAPLESPVGGVQDQGELDDGRTEQEQVESPRLAGTDRPGGQMAPQGDGRR